MNKTLFKSVGLAIIATIMAFSCAENSERSHVKKMQGSTQLVRVAEPSNGVLFTLGDTIRVRIEQLNDTLAIDSLFLFVDAASMGKVSVGVVELPTSGFKLGTRQIRATAWYRGSRQTASVSIVLKSQIKPILHSYRVVGTYPHDAQAYTQGLFFLNGFLVESTGQYGQSGLRKVELKTGKVVKGLSLEQNLFGEGCTYYNGKIYQLTWTSRKGFVYDAETFNLLGSFNYPTQGWGLTSLGNKLVMSDGSNILYFLEPENFAEIRRIEVFDNAGPVNELNELEAIDGKIWANVYQTDRIVIIDPETGAIEAELNLPGLLPNAERHANVDVLNGIAWDSINNRIFVSGKNWPKLFEIKVQ